jgi:hypothetical protein
MDDTRYQTRLGHWQDRQARRARLDGRRELARADGYRRLSRWESAGRRPRTPAA